MNLFCMFGIHDTVFTGITFLGYYRFFECRKCKAKFQSVQYDSKVRIK